LRSSSDEPEDEASESSLRTLSIPDDADESAGAARLSGVSMRQRPAGTAVPDS